MAALDARSRTQGFVGRALDQALRELLLLQSSDWAFMIERGEASEYGATRASQHEERAARLAAIALAGDASEEDRVWVARVAASQPFLSNLTSRTLRAAFEIEPKGD